MEIAYDPELSLVPRGARIIVCGGRDYKNWQRVYEVLDMIKPIEIAEGGASGADSFARDWAIVNKVGRRCFYANWRPYRDQRRVDRSAGPKRNRFMFAEFNPDGTVAFPGKTGTADMCKVTDDGGAWFVRIPS